MQFGYAKLASKAMTTNRIDITTTGIHPFKGFPGNQESLTVESPKKYLSNPEILAFTNFLFRSNLPDFVIIHDISKVPIVDRVKTNENEPKQKS